MQEEGQTTLCRGWGQGKEGDGAGTMEERDTSETKEAEAAEQWEQGEEEKRI